ncbi:MAG: L-ribulose-5-phosphate 4-epimerase [Limnochordia bacterium]|jgi:L-ribulose-5-phosphate 4-epimerase|nr:L-ribulose-5-phosphate 4-epimerase [Limnochordia bacterium]MDI9465526.1 L-ribulose-5-phosphate 4-epimerase [Bacillota bacterium]NLO96005.1 L-ribulose-5-phosphate 4-epimerase [Bacillota bacterium]HAN94986.1 L-ribulose-5-phosphate 4-epimerase [Bacillota bacterium]HOB40483.1 L-ribulose-5-phosphate 4-epimerase [Limnochordia bacterium]
MLQELKEQVMLANQELQRQGLVIYTWGNVSGIDRERGLVVIKPSGVAYEELTPEKMVVLDLEGKIVEGKLRPSSDTPTHLELYRKFSEIGGVVHTHSKWATIWAQAGRGIPCRGTTHADYFYGEIPCTRILNEEEVAQAYELNTGRVIVERFQGINPLEMPAVLVAEHGPFTWGRDCHEAVHNSVVLEQVAEMAYFTRLLTGHDRPISRHVLEKHYLRKHGPGAYYGQK